MGRSLLAVAVVAAVVLSGCAFLDVGGIAEPDSNRPDPDADVLGWEDGYWWNDSVAVDASDGLSKAELEVVTARMMARIERIRGHEFTEDVRVRVISHDEYRSGGSDDPEGTPTEEQFWEATFVVGEDDGVAESFDALYGSAVQGYYSNGRIVVIGSGDGGDLRISRATLVHELEHALQDQQLTLRVNASTRDGTLAGRGITEGDANYVESLYEARCEDGRFDCVSVPDGDGEGNTDGGGERLAYNRGLFVSTFVPYAEGAEFVAALRERGGWAAVDDGFETQPASTEQVIHPDAYPDERPERVTVRDRSNAPWNRVGDGEVVGEATAYAALWYNDVVPRDHLTSTEDGRYTYDHPITAGWGGDRLVAYENDGQHGYVWKTTWDSTGDAREFATAYRDLLESKDATARGDGVYVIEDGAFADAFRVVRTDETVVVVNAPTVGALDGVRDREQQGARAPTVGALDGAHDRHQRTANASVAGGVP
ncbi:hypothetical protein G9C85_08340 [Halorubellus sp. JP-L1]|uniref:Hvo_1808 family surface protein n=1 Tax=Halorubellus sp. JP-L1 TaxID=2715753 RepID=UPI00140D8203|nr:Hvo_1808 family surface protein [Halorubellus sp. JP-L1]NHN41640.1 hypothetical protein [Halorubellus sp. JP-L1]